MRDNAPFRGKKVKMATVRSCVATGAIVVAWLICLEGQAWAYTDPGSGALIWQGVVAACVGLAFSFRRLITWVRSLSNSKTEAEQDK